MMTDCIFCKIIEGEISSSRVYKDDDFIAFLDINPLVKGHVLVVPKKHSETIFDLSDEEYMKLNVMVLKVAKGVKKALLCDGMNIIVNSKKAAEQLVPHVHYHVIPRFITDNKPLKWEPTSYEDMEIDRFKKKIRETLG